MYSPASSSQAGLRGPLTRLFVLLPACGTPWLRSSEKRSCPFKAVGGALYNWASFLVLGLAGHVPSHTQVQQLPRCCRGGNFYPVRLGVHGHAW